MGYSLVRGPTALTDERVATIIRRHIERQFPKVCSCCNRHYETLADWIRTTEHAGDPVSQDAEIGDWRPRDSGGSLSMATCPCGSTLVLTSRGMNLLLMWRLLRWARARAEQDNTTIAKVLARVRETIDEQVIEGPRDAAG